MNSHSNSLALWSAAALMLSSGSAMTAAGAVGIGQSFKGPVGLQLYSLRDQFKKDVPGTLDQVKAFGIKYVETASTYGVPAEKSRALLEERGLKAVSGHFPYEKCRDNVGSIAAEAKT